MRKSTLSILILLGLLVILPVGAESTLEYWEKSPELWRKVLERQILVSAKNEDGRTHSQGVGLARATVDQIWAFATNPEKIKNSSRFLKDFRWDPSTGQVDMQIEVLMIHHRLSGKATTSPDPHNPKIAFEVLEGSLVPFSAVLEIRSQQAQNQRPSAPTFPPGQSLVRISGWSAKDRSLSWPLRWGLEVMLQRTAGHLREAVEKQNSVSRRED